VEILEIKSAEPRESLRVDFAGTGRAVTKDGMTKHAMSTSPNARTPRWRRIPVGCPPRKRMGVGRPRTHTHSFNNVPDTWRKCECSPDRLRLSLGARSVGPEVPHRTGHDAVNLEGGMLAWSAEGEALVATSTNLRSSSARVTRSPGPLHVLSAAVREGRLSASTL